MASNGSSTVAETPSIEDLYRYFGELADAKQEAGKVTFISQMIILF
jgi:hypothetical protein